jgi:predicted DNA-binding transcriptional regulator AlpA
VQTATKKKDQPRMRTVQPNVTGRRYVRNKPLAEYLGISTMCLWRWQRDPKLNFPQPTVVNDIMYTDLDLVDAWMKKRVVDRVNREVA